MAAGSTYTPIATYTVPSAQASYTFTSIPSTYTDLILVVGGNSSASDNNLMQFNSDTGTNYSGTFLYGDGTTASSARSTSDSKIQLGGFDGTNPGTLIVQIMNYANTTTYKTVINRMNSGGYVQARVGLWRSTAAINSVKIYPSASNLTTGSVLTLYGILAA